MTTRADGIGALRPDLTDALQARLSHGGVELPVAVHDKIDQNGQLALVEVAGRQLAIEFPNMAGPPPNYGLHWPVGLARSYWG
ncbi:hypothetical protein N8D56_13035 [Devosia sp. A8/3-2]|nr:hypothetical protein N8D56_13035 [Devosia sp. A8/3-2]